MAFRLLLVLCPTLLLAAPGYIEPWGKDAELIPSRQKEIPLPRKDPFNRLAEGLIRFKQVYISPIDGPRSHFRPTSSRYMQLSMRRHGFIKGFIMGCDRLMRENKDPWVYRQTLVDGKLYKYDPTY